MSEISVSTVRVNDDMSSGTVIFRVPWILFAQALVWPLSQLDDEGPPDDDVVELAAEVVELELDPVVVVVVVVGLLAPVVVVVIALVLLVPLVVVVVVVLVLLVAGLLSVQASSPFKVRLNILG